MGGGIVSAEGSMELAMGLLPEPQEAFHMAKGCRGIPAGQVPRLSHFVREILSTSTLEINTAQRCVISTH